MMGGISPNEVFYPGPNTGRRYPQRVSQFPTRGAGTGSAYLSFRSTHVAWNPDMFHGMDSICREEFGPWSRYPYGGEGLPAVKVSIYFDGDCMKRFIGRDWNEFYTARHA